MIDDLRVGASLTQRIDIIEVAPQDAHVAAPAQLLRELGAARHARHRVPARAQRLHQMGTDKTGASRYKDLHSPLS